MSQTVYVVMNADCPAGVFTSQAAAQSYADKENNLARQRSPLRKGMWSVHPFTVDALAE